MSSEATQRSKASNYFLAIALVFGNYWFGYAIGILNPIGVKMLVAKYDYDGGDSEEAQSKRDNILGLMNNVFSIGALVGVLVTGGLADKLGRRTVMYITDILAIICAVMLFIIHLPTLICSRFLAGVVAGLYNAIGAVILAELMPNSVCGVGNAMGYVFVTSSILTTSLLPIIFSDDILITHCNYFLAFPIIVPIAKLIIVPFLLKTDTPKFIYNNQVDKVRARELIIDAYSHIYAVDQLQTVADETIGTLERQNIEGKITLKTLFSSKFRFRLFSGAFLCFAQQVSGINYLIFYSTELFKASGRDKVMTMVIGLSNFVGSAVALYAIGAFGRKFNIVWGSLGQGIGMLLLFLGMKFDIFAVLACSVVIYVWSFAVGLGGSQMAYISEILPPLGVSISCSVQWIMTAIIAQALLPANRIFGPTVMMLFFTIMCAIFFFSLDFMMIETKDKSEDTINTEFENRQYKFLNFK